MLFTLKFLEISKSEARSSQELVVEKTKWRMRISKKDKDGVHYLAAFLYSLENDRNKTTYWSCHARVKYTLENQDIEKDIKLEYNHVFNWKSSNWGHNEVCLWSYLNEGFLVNDTLTISAEIDVTDIIGMREEENFDFNRSDEVTSNVVLNVGDEGLNVSKEFLALSSPVFKTMFFGEFEEESRDMIEMKDVDFRQLADFLTVVYPCAYDIHDGNVDNMLLLADRFLMQHITSRAEQYLIGFSKLGKLTKLALADKYRLSRLMTDCLGKYTKINDFKEIQDKDKFKNLSDTTKARICMQILKFK